MAQRLPQLEHAELHAVIRAVRATAERTQASQAISGPSLATALLLFVVISLGFLHGALLRAWTPSPASVPPAKENDMKAIGAMAMAAVLGSGALAQDAVQWRVEDGGNGHWYSITATPKIWSSVKADCEALGGHLVSITSAEENSFAAPLAGSGTAWIGAFQPPNSCEPLCDWRWVTGESWGFSRWAPPGANDFGGMEDNAETYGSGEWNDMPNSGWSRRGIIEWSADCNADGIVDYGQIRTGELDDANSNNIPDCCEQGIACDCPADIDRSGAVNGVDLSIILNAWGVGGGKYPEADVNGDGTVDAVDLSFVLNAWGPCP